MGQKRWETWNGADLALEWVTLPDISHMPVIALALIVVTFSINDSEVIPDGLTALCSFEIGTVTCYKYFPLISVQFIALLE